MVLLENGLKEHEVTLSSSYPYRYSSEVLYECAHTIVAEA